MFSSVTVSLLLWRLVNKRHFSKVANLNYKAREYIK